MKNLIDKYIKRIKVDYPEDDKLMIDLEDFAKEIKEQLLIQRVVLRSEQLPKNNCTLNRQTCGKGGACKYPHCHI